MSAADEVKVDISGDMNVPHERPKSNFDLSRYICKHIGIVG